MQALNRLADSRVAIAALEGWRWWTAELAAMVPARLKQGGGRVATADIRLRRDAVEIERRQGDKGERLVDERRLETFDAEGWTELGGLIEGHQARLLLALPDCHTLSIMLPAAARGRLSAVVALQLPQIAPLEPEHLVWACRAMETNGKSLRARVVMARRGRIEQLQSLFAGNDLLPPAIFAETPDGPVLLADAWARPADARQRERRLALAVAAGLVATIPLTTYAIASSIAAINEGRVEVLRQEVAPKIAADRRARMMEATREAVKPLAGRPTASAVLEKLAQDLPETASLQSAEQAPGSPLVVTIDADADQSMVDDAGKVAIPGADIVDQRPTDDGRMLTVVRMARR